MPPSERRNKARKSPSSGREVMGLNREIMVMRKQICRKYWVK